MLILTRKKGESIKIGPEITITVIEQRGNRIRIGVKAPTSTRVLRAELEPNQENDQDDA